MNEVKIPPPKPRDSEPMMVINELAKIFREEIRKNLEEANIPISYRAPLRELARRNGMSQLELANKTRLKPSTVSVTLRKMEEDGYITRETSRTDLRVINVYLTEKGAEIHRINCQKIDMIESAVMKGFTEEEKKLLLGLLIKMRDNICFEFSCRPSNCPPCCQSEEDGE